MLDKTLAMFAEEFSKCDPSGCGGELLRTGKFSIKIKANDPKRVIEMLNWYIGDEFVIKRIKICNNIVLIIDSMSLLQQKLDKVFPAMLQLRAFQLQNSI